MKKANKLIEFFYFLNYHKYLYLILLALSVTVAFLEMLTVAVIMPLFGSLISSGTAPGSEGSGTLMTTLTKVITLMPFKDFVISALSFLFITVLLKNIISVVNQFAISFTTGKILFDVKEKLMEKFTRKPYSFFINTKKGDIIHTVVTSSIRVSATLFLLMQMTLEALKITALVLFLSYVNIALTLVLFAFGFIFYIMIEKVAKNVSYILGKDRQTAIIEQTNILDEFINGVKHIIIYGSKANWLERFAQYNRTYVDKYIKDRTWISIPKNFMEFFAVASLCAIGIYFKINRPDSFASTLSIMGIFAVSLYKILPSLALIGRMRMEIMGTLPELELVYNTLQSGDDSMRGPSDAKGKREFDGLKEAIEFENVEFSYDNKEYALKMTNIRFNKNTSSAIIGYSGSGKTTLINLLLGLYIPERGSILIDGHSINEYRIESFWAKTGYVSQEPFIFHADIYDNITMGDKSFSREDVLQAAKKSGVDGFIRGFSDGYNTVVGQRGMRLSGGQQQMIALARALLRNPSILILDEATSAVDSFSEALIHEAIKNITRKMTVIIISHRMSTLKLADNIIFLKDGNIVESGSHAVLMQKDGYYRKLLNEQNRGNSE